jgi:hypothetical protein
MSKVNWVCATCGQDFTRSYSANRHNNHFHYGKGIIVRFLEYVIGRINGQFPPSAQTFKFLITQDNSIIAVIEMNTIYVSDKG